MSPVLDHVASAQVLEECGVFDITRLGQTQLGITGMSLEKTYRCAGAFRCAYGWCSQTMYGSRPAPHNTAWAKQGPMVCMAWAWFAAGGQAVRAQVKGTKLTGQGCAY